MFADFYDETKSREENQTQYEKARHNKEVTQHYVTAFAVITGAVGSVLIVKKLFDELT